MFCSKTSTQCVGNFWVIVDIMAKIKLSETSLDTLKYDDPEEQKIVFIYPIFPRCLFFLSF